MYIGKLKIQSPEVPMILSWKTFWDQPVNMKIVLSEESFVDRVTFLFGEKTKLKELRLENYTSHTAETGKHITSREITLQVGDTCKELSVTAQTDFSDFVLEDIVVYGASFDGITLFPTADKVEDLGRRFPVSNYRGFSSELSLKAEKVLTEKWSEETGIALEKREDGEVCFVKGDAPANGYLLEVEEKKITLTASDERGFVIAVETLIKLLSDGTLPACKISDAPRHPFRGVHLFLPAIEEMNFAKRLVKYLLSPMGYNAVIIEVAGGMKFDSHPLIKEKYEDAVAKADAGIWPKFPHSAVGGGKALEKDAVRDFVDYIRSFAIEPIPEIQSLGHVQFMTQAYPEIAELDEISEALIDTREEDERPRKFYHHCYCPTNPRSYEILFDLIDEIVEVFRPAEYVHMGHDEVYEIGVCKHCRGKDPAEILAYDLNKIYDYLKTKGLKMMIWADMLQPFKYGTHPAADHIPKDILMLDFIWYFHLDEDIETNLLEKGFKVAIGNLYSSHFPRYNSRMARDGIVGGQISAWVATEAEKMAQEGKFFDFRLTAQMLWSKSYRPEYHNAYTHLILKETPALREKLENITVFSRHGIAEPVNPKAIGKAGKSLRLRHALVTPVTKEPWVKGKKVGEYKLSYADGDTQSYELFAGWNIDMDRRPYGPNPHKLFRHTGYYADYFCTPTPLGGQFVEIPLYNKELFSATLLCEPDIEIRLFETEIIVEE